jgi:hypothetical protein
MVVEFVSLMLLAGHSAQAVPLSQSVWVEDTTADFADGTFDDGGVQFYASAAGDIRCVNHFDFNQDGAIDLVFCNTHDTVEKPDARIYWGKDGSYSQDRMTPVPTDGAYFCIADDLDDDRWPDLVIINRDNGITTVLDSFVYWGGPEGYAATRRSAFETFNPRGCVAADLNDDGIKDLIVANGSFRLGDRRFDNVGARIHWGSRRGYGDYEISTLGGTSVGCVAVGVFTARSDAGRAHPDVFVGVTQGESLLFANKEGELDTEQPQRLAVGRVHQAVTCDLEQDGFDDLVLNGGPGSSLRVCHGSKRGLLAARVTELGIPGGQSIALADIDDDGRGDVVVAGRTANVSTVYWGGGYGFASDRSTDIKTSHASDVVVTDLNADGRFDIILSQQMNAETFDMDTLIVWGSDRRSIGAQIGRLSGTGTMSVSVSDLNRDGDPDVVLAGRIGGSRTGRVPTYIYWNDGHGGFGPERRTSLTTNDNYEAAAADLNLDGYVDLVFAEQYETQGEIGESHIYWGSADGLDAERNSGLMTQGAMGVGVADLNRDGYLDIVFGQLDRVALSTERRAALPLLYLQTVYGEDVSRVEGRRKARIYFGSADGFSIDAMTELQTSGSGTPAVADFNRDDWLDVVFPSMMDHGGAWLYFGGPDGFSEDRSEKLCFERSSKAEAADLNGDGWLDLIFAVRAKGLSHDTYSLVYWGSETGFSEKRRLQLPTRGAGVPSVGDLNRDGRLDVLLTNYASDMTRRVPLYIYWGNETLLAPSCRTLLSADSGSGNEIADFNGDGWPDIAVSCHRLEGSRDLPGRPNTHVAKSFVYSGSADGFDERRRLTVPTIGPHGMLGVDIGHIYHRKLEWIYVSSVHEMDTSRRLARVRWQAKTPHKSSIALQVRLADRSADLARAPWLGPSGPGSWFDDGQDSWQNANHGASGRFAQYRARLRSDHGACYPTLEEVKVGFQ